jgi:hypothetical protein
MSVIRPEFRSVFCAITPKSNVARIADWQERLGRYKAEQAHIRHAKAQAEDMATASAFDYNFETGFSDEAMSEAFSFKH